MTFENLFVDSNDVEHTLPSKYVVCPRCNGRGTSSAYLGAFTREDFDEDPDFARDYLDGAYDRSCTRCNGVRVIEVADFDRMSPALRDEYENYLLEIYYMEETERMERMLGA
jgi:hypothetical protein